MLVLWSLASVHSIYSHGQLPAYNKKTKQKWHGFIWVFLARQSVMLLSENMKYKMFCKNKSKAGILPKQY